jgi:hypothetical protein
VPVQRIAAAGRLAVSRHAGSVYITERDGPNPYDGLPEMMHNSPERS